LEGASSDEGWGRADSKRGGLAALPQAKGLTPYHPLEMVGTIRLIEGTSEIPRQGKVIIDFFATWCGPCKTIAPYYEELSKTFEGVVFLKADVDDFDDPMDEFDVQTLPTFILMNNGVVVGTVKGADVNKVMKLLGDLERA
jgi:thioredoxin 1